MGSTQRYISIARSDLAAVIYDALGGAAELILDDSVQALVEHGDRVRVRFESGQARDFDLVVGADGLHSRVRRLAFGPDQSFERYLGIVVAAFEAEGYRPRDELVAMMHAESDSRRSGSPCATTSPCSCSRSGTRPGAHR